MIIKGLLDAMDVAHHDKNGILFDRIKTVILSLASSSSSDKEIRSEDLILLITEIIAKILNPRLDKKIQVVYKKCYFICSKTAAESKDEKLEKFVRTTNKELMKSYL